MSASTESTHFTEDSCLELILGLLTDFEATLMVEHAASCAPCAEMLRARSAEVETAAASMPPELLRPATLRAEAAAAKAGAGFFERLRAALWPTRLGFATAAAALLLLVVLPRTLRDTPTDLLRSIPRPGEELQLRIGSGGSPELSVAIDAYDRGDLDNAVHMLQELELAEPLESLRRVYLGNALARSGEYARAVDALESIPFDLVPDPWSSEARWTLYVALLEDGRAGGADSLLRVIAKEPGDVGDRARERIE